MALDILQHMSYHESLKHLKAILYSFVPSLDFRVFFFPGNHFSPKSV